MQFDRLQLTIERFVFSKDIKSDQIFTVDLTLCSKCQIDGEDFVISFGLLRKRKSLKQSGNFEIPQSQQDNSKISKKELFFSYAY